MKTTVLILTVACIQVSARTLAQRVTLKIKEATVEQALAEVKTQSNYALFYNKTLIGQAGTISVNLKNASVDEALAAILKDKQFTYEIIDKTIVIKEKQVSVLDNLREKVKELIANIDVRGRVVDESGLPLPGATIAVKGTNNVTATDVTGNFYLHNVDPNATIVITSIGFEKQELPAKTEIGTIRMKAAESKLDEVQVIAYGQTTQRLAVGNIASVSSKTIDDQLTNNVLQTLEGRVPGLQVSQLNGIPGGAVTVHIQGQNSITYGNDPLYVIDGVPYISGMPSTYTGGIGGILGVSATSSAGNSYGSPLDFINPADIESIEVLKDASATSIYGSRAANGAILITTKSGKAGNTKVSANLKQGWGQDTRRISMLNTQQYVEMRREALANNGIGAPSTTDYDINGLWDVSRYTDWQKILVGGTAHYNDYNANISGGNSNTQYLFSAGYHRETTVFPGDYNDQKGSMHFNLNSTSNDQRFRLQLSISYLADNNRLPTFDFTTLSLTLPPDAPALYNGDGTLNWQPNSTGTSSWSNPFSILSTMYQAKTNNLIGNGILSYHLTPELTLKSSFGYTNLISNEFSDEPLAYFQPEFRSIIQSTANYSTNLVSSWIIEPQITYNKTFGKGKLDLLLGSTFQQTNTNGKQLSGTGYNNDSLLQDINSAATITSAGPSVISNYKYNALFGRLNYRWDDKYIVEITGRRDGSSRFGPQNIFHNFWSTGAAWIFSDEAIIKNKLSFLSFGKLRGSYGTTGNDQIGDYKYLSLYSTTSAQVPTQGIVGLVPKGLPNPYLQWEETRKLQFGLDLAFFKDRLLFTTDYVYNRSSNQLLNYALPIFTGFNSIIENFPATVQNTEWEFSINSANIKQKDFSWSTNINLTIPQNKLVSFPNISQSTYAAGTNGVIVGQPLGIIKTYNFLGVDPATGIYQFKDVNGNPTPNPNPTTDRNVLINTRPTYYGGIGNNIRYRRVQLDFFFQFVRQTGLAPFDIAGVAEPGTKAANQPVSILNNWQYPGQTAPIQRYDSNSSLNTAYSDAANSNYNSNASYIRLKNVSLSWELPIRLEKTLSLKNCRIFLQGENLLTITKYTGLDPEAQTSGGVPPLKLIAAGLQAEF